MWCLCMSIDLVHKGINQATWHSKPKFVTIQKMDPDYLHGPHRALHQKYEFQFENEKQLTQKWPD